MRFALLGRGEPARTALKALLARRAQVVGAGIDQGKINASTIRRWDPDVGLTVGYPHLLTGEIIRIPPRGWFNIHSSLLPAYKGRAPLNWAILNGETELGVTLHAIDETVDGGDIIYQQSFRLNESEDVGDALRMCNVVYYRLVSLLAENLDDLPRYVMPPNDKVWPARTDADGEIDWEQPPEDIVRLVRASAPPYPGAWTRTNDGRKLRILKARVD